MLKLLVLLCSCAILARCSELYSRDCAAKGIRYSLYKDWAYITLLVILILFTGLRTSYNDTGAYLNYNTSSGGLTQFLSNPNNLNPFRNPLFYAYQALVHSLFHNQQFTIFTTSVFTQICFLIFLKRYSKHFTFSVFIYITLGTFCFSMAAIKQVVAMSILTLSFPYLEQKKWVRFYLLIILAMLFHTYALIYAVLPLLVDRPWKPMTYFLVLITVTVLLNFQDAIGAFLEQATELGKSVSDEEIFDDHTVNIFRLLVYLLPPVASLIFQRWLFWDSRRMDHVMVHMSIISAAFMSLGTQSGANMFGRMATYFELGTICCLPWMLEHIFNKRSYRALTKIAVVCFMGYFIYAYGISQDFDQEYRAMSLWNFIKTIIPGF